MKKTLLLCISITIGLSTMAQFKESYPRGFRKANAPSWVKQRDVLAPKLLDFPGTEISQNQMQPASATVVSPPFRMQASLFLSDTTIPLGITKYDLQTYASISNRIIWNNDGTISAVWNCSPDANFAANPPYPNRGTGYNYLDPVTGSVLWSIPVGAVGILAYTTPPGSAAREENVRTGFTNIVVTPSGKEMTIAHEAVTSTTYNRIAVNWRATKGGTKQTNAWTLSHPWTSTGFDTWAKACGGLTNENVYVIWNGSGAPASITSPPHRINGQVGPLVFARSINGGVTWEPSKFINEIDSSYYCGFGGDCYSIDATGDTVAITVGDRYTDLVLLKSIDAGLTWSKTIVWKHPIPFYACSDTPTLYMYNDTIVDTIRSHAGDAKVILDHNGMAHVTYSEFDYHDAISTDAFYNPHMESDNLFYWNETMGSDTTTVWDTLTYGHPPAVAIAAAEDLNGNGIIDIPGGSLGSGICTTGYQFGDYQNGFTAMPSMGIDEDGRIYISYQTINELADTTVFHMAHRHMYVVCIPYDGISYDVNSITHPYNIIPSISQGGDGEYQECVYGAMARRVDFANNTAYCLYQSDSVPGNSISAAGSCQQLYNSQYGINWMNLCKIDLNNLNIGIDEITTNDVQIGQNFPNPASNETSIAVGLKKPARVKIEVLDVLGKVVYKESHGMLATGTHILTINTSNYAKGVYTFTIYAGDIKNTRKMIIQ